MTISAVSAFSAVNHPGSAWRALERLLLPNACIACQRWVGDQEPDALVCGRCRLRLRPLLGGCERCRQPLPLIGGCRFCAEWPAELRWARSAVWLDAEAREVVHGLKYGGYHRLALLMAELVARHARRPQDGALVPIPLTRSRLRQRGYNQAGLIAHALSPIWRLPVREELLTRRGQAGSQTALTPEERLANVAGAFAATPPPRHAAGEAGGAGEAAGASCTPDPSAASPASPASPAGGEVGGWVIIVDDVLTTGATLAAAARALARVGWKHIGAITFARALPFERRVI